MNATSNGQMLSRADVGWYVGQALFNPRGPAGPPVRVVEVGCLDEALNDLEWFFDTPFAGTPGGPYTGLRCDPETPMEPISGSYQPGYLRLTYPTGVQGGDWNVNARPPNVQFLNNGQLVVPQSGILAGPYEVAVTAVSAVGGNTLRWEFSSWPVVAPEDWSVFAAYDTEDNEYVGLDGELDVEGVNVWYAEEVTDCVSYWVGRPVGMRFANGNRLIPQQSGAI